MKIAFFEEVLSVRPHNTKDGLFSQCLYKLSELSEEARKQFCFLVSLLVDGCIERTPTHINISIGVNYRLTLCLSTLCKGTKTIKGCYNLTMPNLTYYVQDDYTALVYAGEVVCILPFNIEE